MAADPGPIPIVVLAGASATPATAAGGHVLAGYKGVAVHVGGRTLIEALVGRLEDSRQFGTIYVAGPEYVYAPHRGGAALIDVTGSVDDTLRAGIEHVRRVHGAIPLALTSCDVLPEVETVARVMTLYRQSAPCDGFLPMVRAPEEAEALGASAYKPTYRVVPTSGAAPVAVLPCHLAVVDPAALRMNFIYRVLRRIYRTRNRPIDYRRRVMLPGIVLELLYQDLRHILDLRPPNLTWSVLRSGLPATRELRAGTLTRSRLEDAIRTIFVTSRQRKRHPERRVHMPVIAGLSLALDIDTEEEAAALG